jgi:C4-dicarboxylate-binding protein DctP
MAEDKGLVGINIAAQAESHYFAKNPIRRLADFQGKKLRVNATPAERARMQAFGATAVPMGLAEMITSLQSGVIDGTMSGISIYVNFNLQSVSKTITETNDTLLVSFGSMSKKWLDTLPADLRKTVVDRRAGCRTSRSSNPTTRRSRLGRSGSSAAARSSIFRPRTWSS